MVWLYILQLIIYCAIFTGMVCFDVKGGAINGLYFYPKPVQERAFEIGLSDRETVIKNMTYTNLSAWRFDKCRCGKSFTLSILIKQIRCISQARYSGFTVAFLSK